MKVNELRDLSTAELEEKLAESQNNALKLIQKEGCYFAKSIESLVKELYV
jgi:hypothetical protein